MSMPKLIKAQHLARRLDTPCNQCMGSGHSPDYTTGDKAPCSACFGTGGDRWNTQRASRWLQSTGAGIKIGGLWCTTPELLIEKFPKAFSELSIAIMFDGSAATADDGPHECQKCSELGELVRELEAQVIELGERLTKAGAR